MRLVMKFGGVLMGKSENIKHCAKLVADEVEKENQVVAVVSAMSGVTDSLLEAAEKAVQGDEVGVSEIVAQLELRHYTTAKELSEGDADLRSQLTSKIQGLAQQLRQVLSAVSSLKELTPRSKDLIVSFGERMAAPLLWAALRVRGIPSVHLTGGEAGIITNSVFGSARPLMEETTKRVQERLLPLLEKGVVPVVTGFIGEDPNGVITTLG
ncbi:MAG TPA: aspartate kinase, partial [Candidatus Methanomethylia archaeon]|nr:aspartate kinase [Candidatus Methanomethylicia archaeon]